MKIAICQYGDFENTQLPFRLGMDDLFVVTPAFEKNPAFIEGLRIGAFKFVEVKTAAELNKVKGLDEAIRKEFLAGLEDDSEPEAETETAKAPEPEKKADEETFVDLTKTPEKKPEPPAAEEKAATDDDKTTEEPEPAKEAEKTPDAAEDDVETDKTANSDDDEDDENIPTEMPKIELPDLDKMSYAQLQGYALKLEQAFDCEINRRASTANLKAEIKEKFEKHANK